MRAPIDPVNVVQVDRPAALIRRYSAWEMPINAPAFRVCPANPKRRWVQLWALNGIFIIGNTRADVDDPGWTPPGAQTATCTGFLLTDHTKALFVTHTGEVWAKVFPNTFAPKTLNVEIEEWA